MTEAIITSAIWTGDDMALKYEDCKTKDRVFNKIIRRHWNGVKGVFEHYEDALIVAFEFYPISVFRLLKMSYWEMIDEYECPLKTMSEIDEFFEKHFTYASKNNLMTPYDIGYSTVEYGEWDPCLALDCNRAYVLRRFRIVFIKERRISINPAYLFKERSDIKCIRVKNKKLRNLDELREEICRWLQKIKDATDEDRLEAEREREAGLL